jgi:sugar lactone lactonase YvrE
MLWCGLLVACAAEPSPTPSPTPTPFVPQVTTLAGGEAGYADGTLAEAQFKSPGGIAVDAEGDIYVCDGVIARERSKGNSAIRVIHTDGAVTTLAGGGGRTGYRDGAGAEAQFIYPFGIDVDAAGNVYVADTNNNAIRQITPEGVVTTIAPDADIRHPLGLALAPDGTIYFTQAGGTSIGDAHGGLGHEVRRITLDGEMSWVAGSGEAGYADGPAEQAQFSTAWGITVASDGTLYVADTGNCAVRAITPDGEVSTLAGGPGEGYQDGVGAEARFYYPTDVAVDEAGNVYVVESWDILATNVGSNAVRMVTPNGQVTTLAGGKEPGFADGPAAEALFAHPMGIAISRDGTTLYVADTANNRVRVIPLRAPDD